MDGIPATVKDVMNFFGMDSAEFRREWVKLTAEDKAHIRNGIGYGMLNY